MFFKVIACEIAVREVCHVAVRAPSILDVEFLAQGFHDTPNLGRLEIQRRIDATPAGKYDAILIGYGLCSNILVGLSCTHTRLVIPRAHDCIAMFLGSKERYQEMFTARPGTYYYTSGWLECRKRREHSQGGSSTGFMPAQAAAGLQTTYDQWVKKYGEEQARYLMDVMGQWAQSYTHGVLIDFDFTKPLNLESQVRAICDQHGWQYDEARGDIQLLQRWVDGVWDEKEFLIVPCGHKVVTTYREDIIAAKAESSS